MGGKGGVVVVFVSLSQGSKSSRMERTAPVIASFGRTGVDVGWPRRANVWRPEAVALAARVVRIAAGGEHSLEALEVENLLTVAQLVLACAARRKESRGLHFTRDYVHATDSEKRDTVLSSSDVDLQLTRAMPELVSR